VIPWLPNLTPDEVTLTHCSMKRFRARKRKTRFNWTPCYEVLFSPLSNAGLKPTVRKELGNVVKAGLIHVTKLVSPLLPHFGLMPI